MADEPLTEEELKEIEQQFKAARYCFDNYERLVSIQGPNAPPPPSPSWSELYAGERLLAEVRRLRRCIAIGECPWCGRRRQHPFPICTCHQALEAEANETGVAAGGK